MIEKMSPELRRDAAASYALKVLGALLDDGDLDGHGGLKDWLVVGFQRRCRIPG